MDYYRAFPPYMGYQGYGQWAQPGMIPEDRMLEDMEYLQQMYPTYARKYQSTINSFVDRMDYDGSFIYDQYPDKMSIGRMVTGVMAVIKANEEKENAGAEDDDRSRDVSEKTLTEHAPWKEKEPWIRELVTVLMYYEILTRRKRKNQQWQIGSMGNRYYF